VLESLAKVIQHSIFLWPLPFPGFKARRLQRDAADEGPAEFRAKESSADSPALLRLLVDLRKIKSWSRDFA
jgi:hypothetical protein